MLEVVPTVLDIIVRPSRQHLRNDCPLVAQEGLLALEDAIFVFCPRDVLFEAWIKGPSESTADLIWRPTTQRCGDFRPR